MAARKSSSSTGQATRQSRKPKNRLAGLPNTGFEFLERFKAVSAEIPYQAKSIFPSEMFLFLQMVELAGATHIIESGGRVGGSTTYLTRLFEGRIESVSNDGVTLPGVKKYEGDGAQVVPRLIQKSDAERIAILIDGPKDQKAVDLAYESLKDPRVKFVAVHDLLPEQSAAGQMSSQEESFRVLHGDLDANVGAYLEKYPNGPGLTIFASAVLEIHPPEPEAPEPQEEEETPDVE